MCSNIKLDLFNIPQKNCLKGWRTLTGFDDEVCGDEGHRVSGIDVVAAVDVLSVDGESEPGEELEDPPGDDAGRDLGGVELLRAPVCRVRHRQHRHEHRHRPVVVVEGDQDKHPSQHDKPVHNKITDTLNKKNQAL